LGGGERPGCRRGPSPDAGDCRAREVEGRFPRVQDLFTVRDLGGWPEVQKTLFAPGAAYDRVTASLRARQ